VKTKVFFAIEKRRSEISTPVEKTCSKIRSTIPYWICGFFHKIEWNFFWREQNNDV